MGRVSVGILVAPGDIVDDGVADDSRPIRRYTFVVAVPCRLRPAQEITRTNDGST